MKNFIINTFVIFLLLMGSAAHSFGQVDLSGKVVKITKNDGTIIIGEFADDDGREILLITENLGKVYVPKHEIKSIDQIKSDDMRQGVYVGGERFATRYFLTTNGLPIEKGEHYAMVSVYGPEIHFAVSNNLSVGFLTTWAASPFVGSIKYSFSSNSKVHASFGVLAGGLTFFGRGYGALGYGAVTIGDRKGNVTVSAGYAGVSDGEGNGGAAPLMSVAGMFKTNERISLVGDSFIYLGGVGEGNGGAWALVMPGIRFTSERRWGIQFGIGGIVTNGELLPVPIPNGNIFFSLN